MSRLIFSELGTTPSDTDSGASQLYVKDDGELYIKGGTGAERAIHSPLGYHVIPTTVADLGAEITAAFASGYKAIQLQAGEYAMSTTVDIPAYHTVIGTGYRTTKINVVRDVTAFRLSAGYIDLGGMAIHFADAYGGEPAYSHSSCGIQLGDHTQGTLGAADGAFANRCHVHDLYVFQAGNHGIDCDAIAFCSFGNIGTINCKADGFHINTYLNGCHCNSSYGIIDTRGNKRDGFRISSSVVGGKHSQANHWGPIVASANGNWTDFEYLSGSGVYVGGAKKNIFTSIYGENNNHGYTVQFTLSSTMNDINIVHASPSAGHGQHNMGKAVNTSGGGLGGANKLITRGPFGYDDSRQEIWEPAHSLVQSFSAAPIAKVWCSASTADTPVVHSSYNVSSVTNPSGSLQQVNFATALANTDYVVVTSCSRSSTRNGDIGVEYFNESTTSVQLQGGNSGSAQELDAISVAIFGK